MRAESNRGEQPLENRSIRDIAMTTQDEEVIRMLTPFMDGAMSTHTEADLEDLIKQCDLMLSVGKQYNSMPPENMVDRTGKTSPEMRKRMVNKTTAFLQYLPEIKRRASEALDFKRRFPEVQKAA